MTGESKADWTYPPFDEAVQSFRRFLKDQGVGDDIHWIWREGVCSRRAPGSRRSWDRAVYANLAGSDSSLVERYYDHGVRRNLGVVLEVFCVADGRPCCFVFIPEDETEASNLMVAGLKLSVPTSPIPAKPITNSLLWAMLRLFVGMPSNDWINGVPLRSNAERLTWRLKTGQSK